MNLEVCKSGIRTIILLLISNIHKTSVCTSGPKVCLKYTWYEPSAGQGAHRHTLHLRQGQLWQTEGARPPPLPCHPLRPGKRCVPSCLGGPSSLNLTLLAEESLDLLKVKTRQHPRQSWPALRTAWLDFFSDLHFCVCLSDTFNICSMIDLTDEFENLTFNFFYNLQAWWILKQLINCLHHYNHL